MSDERTVVVFSYGDPDAGIPDRTWEVSGGMVLDDGEHREAVRKAFIDAFGVLTGDGCRVYFDDELPDADIPPEQMMLGDLEVLLGRTFLRAEESMQRTVETVSNLREYRRAYNYLKWGLRVGVWARSTDFLFDGVAMVIDVTNPGRGLGMPCVTVMRDGKVHNLGTAWKIVKAPEGCEQTEAVVNG